jgi:hypothetical protein
MRVLCAIGQRGGPELIRRLAIVTGSRPELLLLHVIDIGPRRDLEQLRGPLRKAGARAGPRGRRGRCRQGRTRRSTGRRAGGRLQSQDPP